MNERKKPSIKKVLTKLRNHQITVVTKFAFTQISHLKSRRNVHEIPHHDKAPSYLKGKYIRYDPVESVTCPNPPTEQHFGTLNTYNFVIAMAQIWHEYVDEWTEEEFGGKIPVLLIGDISKENFSQTICHEKHKTGTHIDFDFQKGFLPADSGYGEHQKDTCSEFCYLLLSFGEEQGGIRILFNDLEIANDLNEAGFPDDCRIDTSVPGHDTHFHVELYPRPHG